LPRISSLSRSQLVSEGHSESVGRTRDKRRVAAADDLAPNSQDQMPGINEIDAMTIFNRRLLFI
jgi:hypothetical protein